MLKNILIALAVVIVAFIIVVVLRPDNFRVSRSTIIAAPPAAIFPQVNDLHSWEKWSPWAKLDPNAKATYDGAPAGVGSSFAWAGNKDVGEGRMTIIESHPNDLIRIRLDFVKPFAGTNTAEFTFVPEGPQTIVTWSMFGKNNFITKAVGLFINCEKMIAPDFEKGLASLKSVVEEKK